MNINMGPTIQFKTSETLNTFVSLNTCPKFSYFTFAKGGYIIRINPIARGIFVVPLEKELINPDEEGIKYPIPTPMAIAIKIQSVRYLLMNPIFLRSTAGAQLFADII